MRALPSFCIIKRRGAVPLPAVLVLQRRTSLPSNTAKRREKVQSWRIRQQKQHGWCVYRHVSCTCGPLGCMGVRSAALEVFGSLRVQTLQEIALGPATA